eukprot:CAMPEP_0114531136 /NCGR_PEP_ID=MMETSP0109-20121206/25883_1 /TAXON_ID=29199 /ORGANISM="Chlorarachnion reptans, Strain CCCM449" /LENGTH=592 /DNA_ID=CAMNT_0001713937 /DNA_START=82 /DNA_END=1857 /DNA_ORIENTATION=+
MNQSILSKQNKWQKVPVRNFHRKKKETNPHPKVNEKQVRKLIATFKTQQCTERTEHDYRICEGYHSQKDKRRNPYKTYYVPNTNLGFHGCLHGVELAYHPLIYRTRICASPKNCPYHDFCAKAHGEHQLRDRNQLQYEGPYASASGACSTDDPDFPIRRGQQMSDIISASMQKRERNHETNFLYQWERKFGAKNSGCCSTHEFPLNPVQSYLLLNSDISRKLFNRLRNVALERLASINIKASQDKKEKACLCVKGTEFVATMVATRILHQLSAPFSDFSDLIVCFEKQYTNRVIVELRPFVNHTNKELRDLWIYTEELSVIIVCSKRRRDAASTLLSQLQFLVSKRGLDKFVTCVCCQDDVNLDQAVRCPNGHAVCTEDCFLNFLKSQLGQMPLQNFLLKCWECKECIDTEELRTRLRRDQWVEYSSKTEEMKLQTRCTKLEREFDERMQAEINKLMGTRVDEKVKIMAQNHAKTIRNTIINLCCPSCKTVYFDFDGCLAIQCETCRKYFCGWCHHKAFENSTGCHNHVRECMYNLTPDGNFYCSDKLLLETGQANYRKRTLKKFLQRLKKEVRNATVIELDQDLKDLGIER